MRVLLSQSIIALPYRFLPDQSATTTSSSRRTSIFSAGNPEGIFILMVITDLEQTILAAGAARCGPSVGAVAKIPDLA